MIITCEACTKRYVVDDQAVGDYGRTVRCVSCGHSWNAKPVKDSVVDLFSENDEISAPNEPKKQKKFRPSRWILVSLFLIAIASGIIVGREHVVSMWPISAKLYKHAGLPIETLGTGLSLQRISVIPIDEKGGKALVVKGTVVNTTSEVKYLPSLKVKAYGNCANLNWWEKLLANFAGGKHANPNLCMLQSWTHTLPETRLFPGERAHFESAPEQTTKVITDLTVSF